MNIFSLDTFSYGIIMGYYGPVWSNEVLIEYADFCKKYGYKYFIYAPKMDKLLRDNWNIFFTESRVQELKNIRDTFEEKGVAFGIGLSPLGLNNLKDIEKVEKVLQQKITQINNINPTILGIFFDDINKDSIVPDLGVGQVQVAEYIAQRSNAQNFASVPSYYSSDQILQRVLGPTPESYFADFSQLDQKFSIFWTGEHIMSDGYSQKELDNISNKLGRKVLIWDNYPVNDPTYLKDHLRISGIDRPQELSSWTPSIAFNPMIQPNMSKIPLSTAQCLFSSEKYNKREIYIEKLIELCGKDLAQAIDQNLPYFELNGINRTETSNIKRMKELFSLFAEINEQQYTHEIIKLLGGSQEI